MMRAVIPIVAAVATAFVSPAAIAHSCPALGPVSGNTITQEFSSGGPGQMHKPAWLVSFGFATAKGLYISGAHFRKAPNEPWQRILWDARLTDIFVPYHTGSPRYYDFTGFSFNLLPATAEDAGPCGRILGGSVVNLVENHELAWKVDQTVRYRESMVLWATLDAAYYEYVMRYEFRDDGSIGLRLGATGANKPSGPFEAHMHNGLWRVDIDLRGSSDDTAYWMRHEEPSGAATDSMPLFNAGVEGSAVWNDLEFNHVLVSDEPSTSGNSTGKRAGYEFMPVRMGTARHAEGFSRADFWVTRYKYTDNNYRDIASYVNGESINKSDVVVWHLSPMHHHPRNEDGFINANGWWVGATTLMWSGVDIRPRDFWDRAPLYPNE